MADEPQVMEKPAPKEIIAPGYTFGTVTDQIATVVLTKKTPVNQLVAYLAGQLVGAALGGGIIWVIAQGRPGFDASQSGFARMAENA